MLIYCQQPVSVTVKRKPQIGLLIHHPGLQFRHMRGAAVGIDIGAVRIIMDRHNRCPQLLQSFDRGIVSRAFRTVYNDPDPVQLYRNRLKHMIDILLSCIGTIFHLAHRRARGELDIRHMTADQAFYFILQRVRQLITVPVKEFNPVKFHRIMRCRNHHSRIHFILLRQISNRRGRQHTYIHTVRSHRTCPRHQCIRKHITRYPGITSDHDRRFMSFLLCQYISTCLPQLHCQYRCKFLICNPSYTVCSK